MKVIEGNEFMISLRDLSTFMNCTPQAVHKMIKDKEVRTSLIGNKLFISPQGVREILLSRGYKFKKQVITLAMLKGGVGKTTTALNVAIRATHYGFRVLCIDLDQQANLSFAFSFENQERPVWVDIVEGSTSIKNCIVNVGENLDLVPSNLNNSVLDKVITSGSRNIGKAVKQYLDEVRDDYDLVIIDTSPNLGAINTAAACASDVVILPLNPDKFSFSGLSKTINELETVGKEFNTDINVKVLFTRFDGREISSSEFLTLCHISYPERMLKSFIRTNTDIKNTIKTGKTIFNTKSPAKDDYDTVAREIIGFAN